MTWPVRSKLLAVYNGAGSVANAKNSLGFVPGGKTWLVKSVTFYNGTGANKTVILQAYNGATGYQLDTSGVMGSGTIVAKYGMGHVLPAGYELAFNPSTTGQTTIFVSGAQLG